VRGERPRRVLPPVLLREVVLEVQIVVTTPEALGHEKVVRLVARGLEARRIAEAQGKVEAERGAEEH